MINTMGNPITIKETPIHEFWGEVEGKKRFAEIYLTKSKNYLVRMYEDKVWHEDRLIKDHSESYAEDCAENWVLGVIK